MVTSSSFFLGKHVWVPKGKNNCSITIEVVNDCAERAIKLITDFKEATASVEEQETQE